MNNLSPDSIENQVQKLEQRAKRAEQTLFSKNAEVQAAQSKLDNLHVAIDKETKRLLAEQEQQIAIARKSLEESIGQQKYVLTEVVQTVADMQREKRSLEDDLQKAHNALTTCQDECATIQKRKTELEDALTADKVTISALMNDKLQLELAISRLEETKSAEEVAVDELKTTKQGLEQRIITLEADYDAKSAEKESQQALLDAKLLTSRQELEQHQQEDAIVRDSLATWKKQLETRDQNLRIREHKVEEGEAKLINNSNLLNL